MKEKHQMKKLFALSIYASFLIPSLGWSQPSLTISGISSGGFMAAQMGVIYSSQFSGVGTVAGGFYFCAGNHMQDKLKRAQDLKIFDLSLYQTKIDTTKVIEGRPQEVVQISPNNPTYQAVGVCMQNPDQANIDWSTVYQNETDHLIDSTSLIRNQKILIYQGSGDRVVHPPMQKKLKEFYSEMKVPEANVKMVTSTGAHNFPTDLKDQNSCFSQSVPYISSCDMDLAGSLLRQLTGMQTLVRSTDREANVKNLYQVTQNLNGPDANLRPNSVADYGYLAASSFCLNHPEQCAVHVALHGCEMSDSFDSVFDKMYSDSVKKGYLKMRTEQESFPMSPLPYLEQRTIRYGALRFALDSGYLDYVEANKLIVLFPQTWITEDNYPLNPKGCWDWYGWTGRQYATNQGAEPRWLMAWIQNIRQNPKTFIGTDANGNLQPKPLHIQEAKDLKF
jgi:poly(3-hydroxybutyrate) depolymerase